MNMRLINFIFGVVCGVVYSVFMDSIPYLTYGVVCPGIILVYILVNWNKNKGEKSE